MICVVVAAMAFALGYEWSAASNRRRVLKEVAKATEQAERNRIWNAIEANRDKTTSLDIQVAAWMSQMDRMSVGRRK